MIIRFVGIIIAVIAGLFIYDNYLDNSEIKATVSSITNQSPKSIQDEFQEFKAQRLKEFEEFKQNK